jgi:hypothetical protein
MLCDGRDLMRVVMEDPFGGEPSHPDIVRFVSILSKAGRDPASLPTALPAGGEWLIRLLAGVYCQALKTDTIYHVLSPKTASLLASAQLI